MNATATPRCGLDVEINAEVLERTLCMESMPSRLVRAPCHSRTESIRSQMTSSGRPSVLVLACVLATALPGCGPGSDGELDADRGDLPRPGGEKEGLGSADCPANANTPKLLGVIVERPIVRAAFQGSSSTPPCAIEASSSKLVVVAANPRVQTFDVRYWCAEARISPETEAPPSTLPRRGARSRDITRFVLGKGGFSEPAPRCKPVGLVSPIAE